METEKLIENFKNEIIAAIRAELQHKNTITPILNSKQVMQIFDISETKLYELRKIGKIPYLKIEGKFLYEYEALLKTFRAAGSGEL